MRGGRAIDGGGAVPGGAVPGGAVPGGAVPGGAERRDEATVELLLAASRVLVGIGSRALEELGGEVSIAQFRLLSVLAEYGPSTSTEVARWLDSAGSSVTRLADRLEDSGHLTRYRGRPNRSMVRLELTASGRALVQRVWGWRRDELARVVAGLPPATVEAVELGLQVFVDAAGHGYGAGPVELHTRRTFLDHTRVDEP